MIKNIFYKRVNLSIFILYIFIGIIYFAYPIIKGLLIATGDAWPYFYPLSYYYSGFAENGFSLWLPFEYLGIPFLGAAQTGLLYPLNIIYFLLSPSYAFNFSLIMHYVLGAFFTFLYVRSIGVKTMPSFLSGIVFGFSGIMIAHKVYPVMLNASIWLPLLLYLFEKIRTTFNWKYSIWAAIIIAVQVFAGHFQICIYTYMVLVFYIIFFVIKNRKESQKKLLLMYSIPVISGLLIASSQLLATLELSQYAWRVQEDYDFFTQGSLHPFMFLLFIFPFVLGGGFGDDAYWGEQTFGAWTLNEYAGFTGILPLIMAILIFIKLWKKNSYILLWGLISIGALFLALGQYNPFYKIMYYIPVYNLFRMPARHLLEFNLAIAVLFGFALNYMLGQRSKESKRFTIQLAWMTLSVGLLSLFLPYLINLISGANFILSRLSDDAKNLLSVLNIASAPNNLLVYSIPFGFAIIYLCWLYFFYRTDRLRKIITFSLIGIIFLEAFIFVNFFNKQEYRLSDAEKGINNSKMDFVKNNAGFSRNIFISRNIYPLFYVPAKVSALNGFEPLVIKDFRELLDAEYDDYFDWRSLLKKHLLLSMLNIRHIVVTPDSLPIAASMEEYLMSNKQQDIGRKEISLDNWKFSETIENKNGVYTLKPLNSKESSLMLHKLSLKSNADYMITFKVWVENTDSLSKLNILFKKSGKFVPRISMQKYEIDSDYFKEIPQVYSRIINTGSKDLVPEEIILSTDSKNPVYLSDIKFFELTNYVPPALNEIKNMKVGNSNTPIYKEVFNSEGTIIYENLDCLPKAYSVSNIKSFNNLEELKTKIDFFEFDPSKTALVYQENMDKIGKTSFTQGEVKVTKYEPDKVLIDASFKDTGFIVLAEQYYPGWKALIDGVETPIYQVNGILRGITVPSGNHSIVFEYFPVKIYIAAGIGGLTLIICIFGLLFGYIRKREKYNLNIKNE